MKARIWKNNNGSLRVVERWENEKSTFDVQVKRHHIWLTKLKGLSKIEIKNKFNIEVEGKPF